MQLHGKLKVQGELMVNIFYYYLLITYFLRRFQDIYVCWDARIYYHDIKIFEQIVKELVGYLFIYCEVKYVLPF